jgi:hypothetical protein
MDADTWAAVISIGLFVAIPMFAVGSMLLIRRGDRRFYAARRMGA